MPRVEQDEQLLPQEMQGEEDQVEAQDRPRAHVQPKVLISLPGSNRC
jgi:hypothetical protein